MRKRGMERKGGRKYGRGGGKVKRGRLIGIKHIVFLVPSLIRSLTEPL